MTLFVCPECGFRCVLAEHPDSPPTCQGQLRVRDTEVTVHSPKPMTRQKAATPPE